MNEQRRSALADLLMRPAAQPMGQQNMLQRLAFPEPTPQPAGYTEARNATPLRPQGVGEMGRNYLAQMAGDAPAGVGANTIMGFTGAATTGRVAPAAIAALRDGLVQRNPGLRLWVGQAPSGHLTVSQVVVPESMRGNGIGSSVMREIGEFADQNGLPVALTPDGSFGGSVTRLKQFYSRLGYRPNTGPSRDLSISESMIRPPGAP